MIELHKPTDGQTVRARGREYRFEASPSSAPSAIGLLHGTRGAVLGLMRCGHEVPENVCFSFNMRSRTLDRSGLYFRIEPDGRLTYID